MPIYLFVYGTLRPGEATEFARRLEAEAQFAGAARVNGRLYRLPHYPCMVRAEEGVVSGDLFTGVSDRLMHELDVWEGSEYRRELIAATRSDGTVVEAWIYIYVKPTDGLRLIACGDWLADSASLSCPIAEKRGLTMYPAPTVRNLFFVPQFAARILVWLAQRSVSELNPQNQTGNTSPTSVLAPH